MISIFKVARFTLLLALAFVITMPGPVSPRVAPVFAQDTTPTPTTVPFGVTLPLGGEALQGVVAITGSSLAEGFQAVDVSFAYASDSTGTWFLIEQGSVPVVDGQLATWDTTTISDGTYHLRLQVFLADGAVLERVVENLRVRNYTIIETSTPPAPGETARPVATARPTRTPAVDFITAGQTPQPLPTNPARLTPQHLRESAAVGVGAVAAVLVIAAIYLSLRALFRR